MSAAADLEAGGGDQLAVAVHHAQVAVCGGDREVEVVSWGALTLGLRGRRVDLVKATFASLVLLGFGYLGTFSPFFRIFEAE